MSQLVRVRCRLLTRSAGDLTPEEADTVQNAAILNVWDVSLPQGQVCLDALAGLRVVSRYSSTSYTSPNIGAIMQVTNSAPALTAYGVLSPINSVNFTDVPNTSLIQIYENEPTSQLLSGPTDFFWGVLGTRGLAMLQLTYRC